MPAGTLTPLAVRTDLTLTPARLEQAADPIDVRIDDSTRKRVTAGHEFMLECLADGRPVYGSTTGFGPLVTYAGRDDDVAQCESILAHLTAGQGPDLDPRVVRATMLVRLWSLLQGRSGVSVTVVDALTAALGTSLAPAVPQLGSVGASGDLVPLAHLAGALKGADGAHAYADGERLPAAQALARLGLAPLELAGRDGLALVNGTSVTAAAAGLAVAQLTRSATTAFALTCVLADLLGATSAHLHPRLLEAFGHPEAEQAGQDMREFLVGLRPSGSRPLQEPYSVRCAPQLLGAARAGLDYAARVITHDLNGVSDNPLFFAEDDLVTHGGNFFGQPAGFAADHLTLIATQLANLAERQLDLLVDPHRNTGLPPLLAADPGRQHGVAGVQITATAIVADMRRSATPASIQSLPTNLHNQDIVPLGTQAALNALRLTESLRLLHGSLAVALRQAVHVGGRRPTAPVCEAIIDLLTETIAPVDPDRPLHTDVRTAADLLDEITADRLT